MRCMEGKRICSTSARKAPRRVHLLDRERALGDLEPAPEGLRLALAACRRMREGRNRVVRPEE
jgi:hypothetical protein